MNCFKSIITRALDSTKIHSWIVFSCLFSIKFTSFPFSCASASVTERLEKQEGTNMRKDRAIKRQNNTLGRYRLPFIFTF